MFTLIPKFSPVHTVTIILIGSGDKFLFLSDARVMIWREKWWPAAVAPGDYRPASDFAKKLQYK